jgi:hypothetical protein
MVRRREDIDLAGLGVVAPEEAVDGAMTRVYV